MEAFNVKKRKVWLREAHRAEFVEHRESSSCRKIRSFYTMIRSFYHVIRSFYMMIRSFYWKLLLLKKRQVWLREARRAEFVEHRESSSYRKIRSFYTMIRSFYNVIRSFYWKRLVLKNGKYGCARPARPSSWNIEKVALIDISAFGEKHEQ